MCQVYIYKNREPRGGMEDGTWNKALCFVYITCTMGSVGGIQGIVYRQTGGSMSAGSAWECMGAAGLIHYWPAATGKKFTTCM